ncbi:MAG TPA: preprotein translocase subunit SecA [Candidatus Portnoybacteria bacterium]|jgi:preprotein translocase subunit SecA|nr:preprotein translocase subunit SecA [Candidatus Portnoybacteria bacterium]MDD5752057.1 preprotein translocase subunit SecA [Candidatus Portnoybacteria bacterium]HOZ16407.1 preprotein translocase subunit SecA [Candidatus Portnoybacteria bacterium]HPH52043.1 preprotein translocase subunit SecA [Candidatus Portnoybacteria bacterium]HPJ80192.1 preprotein translocase subunit SecA [Candidatus Portnoybacteria bacterium]
MLGKLFGDPNKKYLNKIQSIVDKINKLEFEFEHFSNEALKQKTEEFKNKIKNYGGQSSVILNDILPEAFAVVREVAKRTLKQRHFDVQLIGGIVLHQGKIAEMKTGEGKTLTATLALYLNALEGKGAQLVTVNDYLARRDMVWMGQIYNFLGLSVSCINHEKSFIYDPAYAKTVAGKPELELDAERDELGKFKIVEDYLRPCTRKEAYEADILYGTNNEFGFDYLRDNMAYDKSQIVQKIYNYAIVDEVDSILIDEARTPLIISAPDVESADLYKKFSKIVPQLKKDIDFKIDEKMRAATMTNEGMDKIEKVLGIGNIYEETSIQIVHHIEQALRAEFLFKRDKDYVVNNNEVIIIDEFTGRMMPGRRYSGGLHQALEAKENVLVQKESKTMATITFQNYFRMYKKLAGMTGTALSSAEEFDRVYKLDTIVIPTNNPMIRQDLQDQIYKTEQGKFKAIIEEIKQRHKNGQPILIGTISIEKNEYLGALLKREGIKCEILNAKQHEKEGAIIAQAGKLGAVTVATNMAGRGVDIVLGGNPQDIEEAQKIKELGGLHVLGTERHEARRIDNQLRGRSGRQGDSGSTQFFVSLEDELMQRFGADRIKNLMDMLKVPEDQPIKNKMISSAIEKAQAKIEGYNFDIRKHVLEYDEVMNRQREAIYNMRKEILFNSTDEEIHNKVKELMDDEGFKEYGEKIKGLSADEIGNVEKFVMLRTIDMLWMEHLETMECLRDSVNLRAYGQRDPLVEYKNEGHRLFKQMMNEIDNSIVEMLLKVELKPNNQDTRNKIQTNNNNQISKSKHIGRNDPCPCGATHADGRPIKYKHCCGKNA